VHDVDADVLVGEEMPKALGEALLRIVIENQGAVSMTMRNRFFEKFATGGKQGGSSHSVCVDVSQ
jgi:hypothetical protein